MKYSILVLGASISISLFIRICCCVRVNNSIGRLNLFSVFDPIGELEVEQLYSGRAEDVYEKFLVTSIITGEKRFPPSSRDHVQTFVRQWMKDSSPNRLRKRLSQSHPVNRNHAKYKGRNILNSTYPNEDYCQNCGKTFPPPDLDYPDCDSDSEHHICIFDNELPPGCIYNDVQKEMKCNDDQITKIPRLPTELETLDLSETNIQKIPPRAIMHPSINVLRLISNPIDFIHPYAFQDVKNLRNLFIVGNDITCISNELYVGLDNTVLLDLKYNRISFEVYKTCPIEPEDKIMTVLPMLVLLRLTANPLKVIPKQMFAGLRESPLTALYLDDCQLTEIHQEAFSYLEALEVLNLSKNTPELMQTLDLFLNYLPNLKNLYLADNRLTSFPRSALEKFGSSLKVLDMSGNVLGSLSREDLAMLPALEELYLDDAGLSSIANDAFDGSNIAVLSLKYNRLRQIPAMLPETLTVLQVYNLAGSNRLSPTTLQNLTNLRLLELDGVNLEKLKNDTFANSASIRTILINNGNIKEIEEGAFRNFSKLSTLQLTNNPSSTLSPRVFSALQTLITLNMSNNNIAFPINDTPEFPDLPNLVTLDLSKNNISKLSPKLFRNLSKMRNLHLSKNPIESWNERLFPERNENSTNFTGYTFEVLMDDGNIRTFTGAMFEDFQFMTFIDLSRNPLMCEPGTCEFRNFIYNDTIPTQSFDKFNDILSYECFDSITTSNYFIANLTDDICLALTRDTENPNFHDEPPPAETYGLTKIISISAAFTVIMSVVIVLAYKNRMHLRYYLFYFKFHVMPLPQRKAKLSTMDEDGSIYDFDVFISYHKQDSTFIEDVFLPEIELRDSRSDTGQTETSVNEAKNLVYFIGNDKADLVVNNITSDVKSDKSNVKRFRVCLHERDFAAGLPITENIVDCVDRSRKTVIFISRKYMESQWCSFELNLVYHRLVERRRKAFVLVLMEDIPQETRTKILNYLMASKTYLQWPGMNALEEEKASFWKRLRTFLQTE